MFKMILISISAAMSVQVWAADQAPVGDLSIDNAVDEAYGSSPMIQRSEAAAKAAGYNANAVFGEGYLPKVQAGINHDFSVKWMTLPVNLNGLHEVLPEVGPYTTYSLDANIPVFDGWVSTRKWTAAQDQYKAGQRNLDYDKFTLRQNVRISFYEALAAQMIHDVYVQNVKTLEEHLRLTKLLQSNGAATNFDTLRVEVQLNEARSDEIEARDNVEIARKKLVQVMGKDSDSRRLIGEMPKPEAKMVQNLSVDPSTASRADIEALDLQAQASERMASAAASWLVPKISITGNYTMFNNQSYSSDMNSRDFSNAYSFGAMLTWNIFDGNISHSRAQEAAQKRIEADKAAEAAKQALPVALDQWKRKYLSSFDRYEVRTLDVTKSEEEVRLARQEQKAGTRTSSEVLDAEVDMFKAKAGVVNAQLMAAQAMINLEMALGRGL